MILRNVAFSVLSALFVISCSEPTPTLPPTSSNPNQPTQPTQPNSVTPIMQFIPKLADAGLDERGGALSLIFGAGVIDPFDSNNSSQSVEMDFRVRSERVDASSFKNFVTGRVTLRFKRGAEILATREFESQGEIILQNVENEDVMSGTLKDVGSGSVKLSISARRTASSTAEAAAQNPWRGSLQYIETDNRETLLGTIEGFFSGAMNP
jgi:hypothetical protein